MGLWTDDSIINRDVFDYGNVDTNQYPSGLLSVGGSGGAFGYLEGSFGSLIPPYPEVAGLYGGFGNLQFSTRNLPIDDWDAVVISIEGFSKDYRFDWNSSTDVYTPVPIETVDQNFLAANDGNNLSYAVTIPPDANKISDSVDLVIPLQNASTPMTSLAGWVDIFATQTLLSSSVLYWAAGPDLMWTEQTVNLTAEQQQAISDGSYQLTLEVDLETPANEPHRIAFNVDYLDDSNNYLGGLMRQFGNYEGTTQTLSNTQWIAPGTTKVTLKAMVDRFGSTSDINLQIKEIRLTLSQHPTRKAAFLYANKDVFDTADFDIFAGDANNWRRAEDIGFFGAFLYPARVASTNQQNASMNKRIAYTAEQITGAQAGTATLMVQAYHFNENDEDRTRSASNQEDSQGNVSAGPDLPLEDAGRRGNFRVSAPAAVLTTSVASGAYYQGSRFDGAVNDGCISDFSVVYEYDNPNPP